MKKFCLFIKITDKEKEKFLYNPIELVKSYINMLTSYDSLLANKGYISGVVLKESKILKGNKTVTSPKGR